MASAIAAYYICAWHDAKHCGKKAKARFNPLIDEIYGGSDKGSDTWFYRAIGFSQSIFDKLYGALVPHCNLSDSRHVAAEERLAIFCHFLCTGKSSREMQERFQRSGWTITKSVQLYITLQVFSDQLSP
jgi:hypothetical protein